MGRIHFGQLIRTIRVIGMEKLLTPAPLFCTLAPQASNIISLTQIITVLKLPLKQLSKAGMLSDRCSFPNQPPVAYKLPEYLILLRDLLGCFRHLTGVLMKLMLQVYLLC